MTEKVYSQSGSVFKDNQELDLDKFHKVASHACDGVTGVSVSDLEIKTHIQLNVVIRLWEHRVSD